MRTTESQIKTETKLKRIAWLSATDKGKKFDCLMHHFNDDSLAECFQQLDGKKAVGTDGVTKACYGEKLNENIRGLSERMRRMAYRPRPVREILIPKEGKPGAKRPLGISNLEDKIIQLMMQRVLESIYEPLFLDCSFGFRLGRGCHDAIRALHQHLFREDVKIVIDVDLENYFGTIDHEILEAILREKIKDERFMRYIKRMFKAGVLSEGELKINDEGVPQGSICSPILSNIFAHYVLDTWFEETVKRHCRGRVELFRYCDDAVICCQFESDAQRIVQALSNRLAKYKLKLNEEKTRLVSFSKSAYRQGIKQEGFDFLGFNFYLGRSHKGVTIPKLKSSGKRLRTKLKRVNQWARSVRNKHRLKDIWRMFCAKLRGHIQYYAVSFNGTSVQKFLHASCWVLFKWLNRRSQRRSFTWEKFTLFIQANPLPQLRIYHALF